MSAVSNALSQSKYVTAIRHILKMSPKAEEAFDLIAGRRVRQQVRKYKKSPSVAYPLLRGMQSVDSFSWENITSEVQTRLPTLGSILYSAMPTAPGDENRTQILRYVGDC